MSIVTNDLPCLQDKTVVVITSGANMNFDRLRLVSELADIGALREAMLATAIPESPGSFREFIDVALSDPKQSVTEFKYRSDTWPCPGIGLSDKGRSQVQAKQLVVCCHSFVS